jgi:hypothetical protein
MKLAIRRISLQSLGKTGCVLGLVLACLPSLLCGILGMGIVQILRHWLEGWQGITITLFGRQIASFDLVQHLGLTEFLKWLQVIGGASWLAVALVVLVLGLFAGLVLAAITVLAGLTYNLLASATGGVVVDAAVVKELPAAIGEQESAAGHRQSAVGRKR